MQNEFAVEDLLAQRGWLVRLARGLVQDHAEAEDLAQGALAIALEKRPQGVRSPRAWLAQVARNLASDRRQGGAARRHREAASARAEAQGSTADLVASTEIHRRLGSHVMALDEPYRSTLVLHYFEGLCLVEVARRSGVAPSTARSRTARGLELLRQRMDADGDGRERWMAALAPLVAAEGTGRLGSMLLAAGAALLLGAGGFAAWFTSQAQPKADALSASFAGAPAPAEQNGNDPLAVAPAALGAPRAQIAPPAVAWSSTPAAEAPKADLPPGTIEIQVDRLNAPLAGAKVLLSHQPGYRKHPDLIPGSGLGTPTTTDANGRACYTGIEPGDWPISLSVSPGHLRQIVVRLEEDQGQRAHVRLGNEAIRGHVYDQFGRSVPDAAISWNSRLKSDAGFWTLARSRADGSFLIEHVLPGPAWLNYEPTGSLKQDANMATVQVVQGETLIWSFGSPKGKSQHICRLVTASGLPAIGEFKLSLTREPDRIFRQHYVQDGTRAFELILEPGNWIVRMDTPTTPFTPRVELARWTIDEQDTEREFVMPGYRLTGSLTLPADTPDHVKKKYLQLRPVDEPFVYHSAVWASDGRWVLDAVPPGRYDLFASAHGIEERVVQTIEVIDQDLSFDLAVR